MVENILDLVAAGCTFDVIVRDAYPQLTQEQFSDVVSFANDLVKNEIIQPVLA